MYIDSAYLNLTVGTARVSALCATAGEVDAVIELAEAKVESALKGAGYDTAVPSSVYTDTDDVPKQIKLASLGLWLVLAHGRHNRTVPNDPSLKEIVDTWRQLHAGELEIPELEKNVARAVGGVIATEADPDTTGSVPQVFTRESMEGY